MSLYSAPQLVIISRPMTGARFDIPDGHTEIGSAQGAGIQLDIAGVSQRHASINRTGDHVVIHDLGSSNGTWVNGRRIDGGHTLRDGDRLQLGWAELQFQHSKDDRPAPPSPPSFGFGDVHGPVNAGSGTQYMGGYHQVAGRDIHGDDYNIHINADDDPIDELFQSSGPSRMVIILGSCMALLGFGIFAFSLMTMDGTSYDNPFLERELLPGIPMVPAGFFMFLIGAVIASIGSGMSKAARRRADERRWHGRQRRPS